MTDAGLTIGVDVGGTSVRAGVVDAFGNVHDTASAATPRSVASLEAALAGVITDLTARHPVTAVGLALAGFITPDRRTVRFAPHLAWRDAPVSERMSARLGLPVVVEHDANAAALAERHFGAAAGASTAVFIALGTGIGSALLLDGELFRGAFGVAPELGPSARGAGRPALPVRQERLLGALLQRHRAGHHGRRAAGPGSGPVAALHRLVVADQGRVTGRLIAAAAREGDPVACAALAELARWLGEGLALVADVFDPELVVIGVGCPGRPRCSWTRLANTTPPG